MENLAERILQVRRLEARIVNEFLAVLNTEWLPGPKEGVRRLYDDVVFDVGGDGDGDGFDLTGCDNDLVMPDEALPKIFAAGFRKFWISHRDCSVTFYQADSLGVWSKTHHRNP